MIYAFIPARSGSTRLTNKNILKFKGKRLFEWSVEIADKLEKIDKIIFSSDSIEYINFCKSLNLSKELIIDKRNKDNSSSKMKIYDYLKFDFLKNNKYLNKDDSIIMLLPTQPFRSISSINEMINYHIKENQNIFSCREYSFPLSFSFEINSKVSFEPVFDNSPLLTGNTRSQDQKIYYHPDGSVYLLKISSLKKNNNTIYKGARPIIINNSNYIDINNESDLLFAESINTEVITQ